MLQKHYNIVLFDWDGCLANTLGIWLAAYKKTFAEYGLFPDESTITHEVFGEWRGPEKVGIKNNDEFIKKLMARVNATYTQSKLNNHAFDVISRLKKNGKRLGIITSSEKRTITEALTNTNLTDFFDVVYAKEDVTHHKPHPEIIHKSLKALGGKTNEAIVIGDSKSDLEAARRASVDAILYYPAHNEMFYNEHVFQEYTPVNIVRDLKEILDIIIPS